MKNYESSVAFEGKFLCNHYFETMYPSNTKIITNYGGKKVNKYLIVSCILLVSIGIIFQSIISPNLGRNFHHTFTKSIDLSDQNVEGLRVYDKIDNNKIVENYGKQVKQSRNVINYSYFELRKGIEVAVNQNKEIVRFIINDEELETVKGIKIGSTDSEVKNTYGNNYYYRREQGAAIIGYVDKAIAASIEFWMYDNKVEWIRFDDVSMQ